MAGDGKTGSGGTQKQGGSGPDPGTYYANVSYTHRGEGDSPQPVKYSGTFTPPVCWYTAMTPDQMRTEIKRRYNEAGQKNEGTVYNFYNDQNNQMEDSDHYHQGKDGSWWVLTWDQTQLDAGNYNCPYSDGYFWRGPTDPPAGRITPEVLAQAAYGQMKLPSKGVSLSPAPDNQKVNLPTYVGFQGAGAAQVSVTAQLTEPDGQVVAATVVAQPSSLQVNAGTPFAQPGSCTYAVGAAALDTAGAACNITYNKATSGSGYPFSADMTWQVWWTPTATVQPAGTALNPGFSEYRVPVTVQEIQTVNR